MIKKVLTKLGLKTSPRKITKFHWAQIDRGFFQGITLYLPELWESEVIDGEYEQGFFNVIKILAKQGGVFYDVGTHIGWFAIAWLKAGGDFVEAFEPLEENRNIIVETLGLNKLSEYVNLHSVALGNVSGISKLFTYPNDTSRTFVQQEEQIHIVPEGVETFDIEISRLDDFYQNNHLRSPDLIKIDVEGLESDVLEGAVSLLSQYKPVVIVEVHSTINGLRTAALMSQLGYQMCVAEMKGKKKSLPLILWVHPESEYWQIFDAYKFEYQI